MSSISDAAIDLEQALKECAREPIHIPGSIQPMGFLLLYDLVKNQILAASQNMADYTGKQPAQVLDQPSATPWDKKPQRVCETVCTKINPERTRK